MFPNSDMPCVCYFCVCVFFCLFVFVFFWLGVIFPFFVFNAALFESVHTRCEKSNIKAMNRNWGNQKANPALKTKTGNK